MRKEPCLSSGTFLLFLLSVTSGNLTGDRICGTFFSESNCCGDSFLLRDQDQSVNTQRDYRSSINGWGNTSSIRVEENCLLRACTGTYFEGDCESFPAGDHSITEVKSASCTCSRNRKCEDVVILKNSETCGRAYLNGSCDEYIPVEYKEKWSYFPEEYGESVTSIIIRGGCNLTVYTKSDDELDRDDDSRVITGPGVLDFQGKVGSYECKCDDNAHNPTSRPTPATSVSSPLILPKSSDELMEIIFSNVTLAQHPGLIAAKKSLQSGRSNRNAYILLIGNCLQEYVGLFSQCSWYSREISECHVQLDLPEMNILQAQLRVISASFHPDGSEAQWVASLDKYLSTHEDLKDSIPNAVIVHHWPMDDSTISEKGSEFQRNLAAVNALRGRLLDENYSNLVFAVFDDKRTRNPETKILAFEAAINENWNFPRPTVILPVFDYSNFLPKINGHWKMTSGEYYYQNIYQALLQASEKSGDALGHGIFEAAFPVQDTEWTVVHKKTVSLLPASDAKVEFHEKLASDPGRLQAFASQAALPRQFKLYGAEKNLIGRDEVYLKVNYLKEKCKILEGKIEDLNNKINETIKAELERIKKEIRNAIKVDFNKLSG